MEQSVTSYVELYSVNQLFAKMSQSSSQDGKNQSSLDVMLMETSTKPPILSSTNQASSNLFGLQRMEPNLRDILSLTSRDQV